MGTMVRRFTAKEYHQMAEAHIFDPEERLELIDGEIVTMTPIGWKHALVVARLTHMLAVALGPRGIVWPQNPLAIDDYWEPQPDICVLQREPEGGLPGPGQTLLAIEVSTESDRRTSQKLDRYRADGIADVWHVDLARMVVDVWQGAQVRFYRAGDVISLQAFPDIRIDVDVLFAGIDQP